MLQSKNNKYYSHKHTNIITSIINKVIIAMLIISAITCMNPIGTYGHTIKASKGITLRNSKKKDIPKGKMKITDIPRDLIADAAIDVQNIKSIDDIDSLDLKSFTTVNADNTKTVYVYNEPIKYYDSSDNSVKFINNALKKTTRDKYLYENTDGEYKIFIPENIKRDIIIKDNESNDMKFRPNVETKRKAKKTISKFLGQEEEVVEYKDIFGKGYDLQYIPQNNSIKENIIIKKNRGIYEFEFIIEANGLIPDKNQGKVINFVKQKDKNNINLTKNNSNAVFSFGELFIRDSYSGYPDGNDHISINNYYTVTDLGSYKYKLIYRLDEKFLNAKSTKYPVLVDPSISPIKKIYDAPVYTKRSSENFKNNAWIQIGKIGGTYGYGRGYFKTSAEQMKKLTYINPQNIVSANLRLYEGSGTTYTSKIKVYNNENKWNVGNITYNNKPKLSGSVIDTVKISKSGFYNFKITSLVKNWLKSVLDEGGYDAGYGVALIRDTSADGRKDFCSANYGETSKQPSITITYNEDVSILDNTYFITNYNSGKRLEAIRENREYPRVIQNAITSNDNQQWKIKYKSGGYYTLANRYYGSKGYLDVNDSVSGNPADIWIDGTDAYNRFKIIKNNDGSGTYRIMSKQLEDLEALNIGDGSKENNARAKFSAYSGAKKSKWILTLVKSPYDSEDLRVSSINIPKCITFTTKDYSVNILSAYITTHKDTRTKIEILNSENSVVYETYKNTPAMDGGTSKNIKFQWRPSKKGNYTFRITVDVDNAIAERDENNNVYIKKFYVAGILPVSGYEIPYEPNKWNDAPKEMDERDENSLLYVQFQTNCYAYALNLQRYPLNPFTSFPLPINRWPGCSGKGLQPEDLYLYHEKSNEHPRGNEGMDAIEANALRAAEAMKYTFRRINREDMCSKGTYKIALVIYSKFDYHWYRQNPDGTWSHKPGYGEVMNKDFSGKTIYDPAESDTGVYGNEIRYYEVSQIKNGMQVN